MTIHTTAADRAALTTTPANDRLLIFQLARLKQEARMSIPDRSRFDDDVAAILNPLAQLRAANDALLAQNESLLDGAAKRQGYVEAIEAQNAAHPRTRDRQRPAAARPGHAGGTPLGCGMKPLDLLNRCWDAQMQQARPDADVFLNVSGRWGKRTHARLFGRHGGPLGRIVGDQIPSDPPRCIAVFKADAIVSALTNAQSLSASKSKGDH